MRSCNSEILFWNLDLNIDAQHESESLEKVPKSEKVLDVTNLKEATDELSLVTKQLKEKLSSIFDEEKVNEQLEAEDRKRSDASILFISQLIYVEYQLRECVTTLQSILDHSCISYCEDGESPEAV